MYLPKASKPSGKENRKIKFSSSAHLWKEAAALTGQESWNVEHASTLKAILIWCCNIYVYIAQKFKN